MEHPPSVQKTFEEAKGKTERAYQEVQRGVRGATEQTAATMKQIPQTTKATVSQSYSLFRDTMSRTKHALTAYIDKYPTIGGFLTVWAFFSLIPFGIFLFVTLGSLLTTSGIATVIVFTINGGVFTFSSFILGIALFCTFVASSFAYFWFIAAGVARSAASRLLQGVQSNTRRIASKVDEGTAGVGGKQG